MWEKKLNHWIHQCSDLLVCHLLTLFIPLLRCFSPEAMIRISKVLGKTIYLLHKKYRTRVIENLSTAFGSEKNPDEIIKLAREVFFHSTLIPLEMIYA